MEIHIIIIVVCVFLSAYFSATETAFSTFNRIRVKNMAEKGDKKATLALKLSDNYDSLISTILIGNNLVNIAATSIATVLAVNLAASMDGKITDDMASTITTFVMTVLILIFGEITPKIIARRASEGFAKIAALFREELKEI